MINLGDLVNKIEEGEATEFLCLITEKKVEHTSANKPYLNIRVQDAHSVIEFPVWDNFSYMNSLIEVGNVYRVEGVKSSWQGKMQIKAPLFFKIIDFDISDFVPSYSISEDMIQEFLDIVRAMPPKWRALTEAATGCLGYNEERWKLFLTSVSAVKYHGNKRGGLFLHTVGVLKNVECQIYNYVTNPFYYNAGKVIDTDRLRFKAIFHDLKKVDEYEFDTVIKRRDDIKTDHIVNGIIYLNQINNECGNVLTHEEMEDIKYSILSHHGQYGKFELKSLEDWLLHLADMIDARIVGEVEK